LSVLRVQGAWFASAPMHRKEADAQLDARRQEEPSVKNLAP